MNLLIFDRSKYGKELLIDASTVQELVDVGDAVSMTFYMIAFIKKGSGTFLVDTEHIDIKENVG